MSNNSPTGSVVAESPFVFQPPAGGDLTLQSSDGTTFQVHSVLLGLASTVFAGMLTGETKPDTVELAEDAETISLLLAFIYPVDPPTITTVDRLEKVMLLSQKYDIDKLIKIIERCNQPNNQLILSDPIRVFRASVKHNFPTIRTLSAQAAGTKHLDPHSLKGLEELAEKFPEASSVIGLIGAQLVRGKLLARLLKDPSASTVYSPEGTNYYSPNDHMACTQCYNQSKPSRRLRESEQRFQYTPGWVPFWLTTLHDRLIKEPMDPCEDILSLLFIADLYNLPDVVCPECVKQTLAKRSLFEQWARDTKCAIDKELKAFNKLHSF